MCVFVAAKRLLLVQLDGGSNRVFIKDGIPQVDLTLDRCSPKTGSRIPSWLAVTTPSTRSKGKVIMKATLGKRVRLA